MGFAPTYNNLDDREPWRNKYYNQLCADLNTDLNDMTGAMLAVPFTLAGDLDGNGNQIWGFRGWLGSGVEGVRIVDVTGYGAKGDGSTDDSGAIQDAIDSCATWGGCVFFPPGDYYINSVIYMAGSTGSPRNNITLMGVGKASKLTWGTSLSVAMIMVGHSSVSYNMMIQQLYFYTTTPAPYLWPIIALRNTIGTRIIDCHISGSRGMGIDVSGSMNAIIRGCDIERCGTSGIGTQESLTTNGLSIVNCTTFNNTYDGIGLIQGRNFIIRNNTAKSNGRQGIRLSTEMSGGFIDFTIHGNTCNHNTDDGIWLGVSGEFAHRIESFSMTENTCNNNGGNGMRLGGTMPGCKYFTVSDNHCSENDHAGIKCGCVFNGALSGNHCLNNGKSTTDNDEAGIFFDIEGDWGVWYISVEGNDCSCIDATDQEWGIKFDGTHFFANITGNMLVKNQTENLVYHVSSFNYAENNMEVEA